MRARTITTIVVLGALAIPVSASAVPTDSGPYAASPQSASVQLPHGADYSSVNSITGGSNESSQPSGSQDVGSGYSSLNAITGPPSSEPTLVSSPPANADDGFDWLSAAIGAAAAMALVGLGSALLLTVRRRPAVSPSAASMS